MKHHTPTSLRCLTQEYITRVKEGFRKVIRLAISKGKAVVVGAQRAGALAEVADIIDFANRN